MYYSFYFTFEGTQGMCMVHRPTGHGYVMWSGMGFQVEAAKPELLAAIKDCDPEGCIR